MVNNQYLTLIAQVKSKLESNKSAVARLRNVHLSSPSNLKNWQKPSSLDEQSWKNGNAAIMAEKDGSTNIDYQGPNTSSCHLFEIFNCIRIKPCIVLLLLNDVP